MGMPGMGEEIKMEKTEFDRIERGAILQNKGSGESYVVDHTLHHRDGKMPPGRVRTHIGVRTIAIRNPDEWILIKK